MCIVALIKSNPSSNNLLTINMKTCNKSNEAFIHSSHNDYTFLYDYLIGTGVHNFSESVTIGFLGAYGQAQVVLGALPLAVEAVNEDKGRKKHQLH